MRGIALGIMGVFIGGLMVEPALAEELAGKKIVLDTGDSAVPHVPVRLKYDGPKPEGRISVVDAESGTELPASLSGGVLTFVLDEVEPDTTRSFVVAVEEGTSAEAAPAVRVEKQDDARALDVYLGDQHFTTYHYANEDEEGNTVYKPYMWPVLAGDGVAVTRAWPMGEAEDKQDHPHHKSFWSAYGDVNGVDTWAEGADKGQQYSKFVTWGGGDAYGWIHAENVWRGADEHPVVDETRTYRFYAGPLDAKIFDLKVTFTASYGDVVFGDTKEGGIAAMRVRDQIRADRDGSMTISTGQTVSKDDEEGLIWGKPATWLDYWGPIEDEGVFGIAIMDHPDNLRHPTRWHARKYGLVGANCFGLSFFVGEDANGDYTLAEGETLTFQYRMLVHEGDTTESQVADRYAQYVEPPQARWAE